MNIIAFKNETFDKIITESVNSLPKVIEKTLEDIDRKLALFMQSNSDCSLIRLDKRTILSSVGELSFRRRYYYNKFLDKYFYPLDEYLEIPKYSRFTNELRLFILYEASRQTYGNISLSLKERNIHIDKSTICRIVKDSIIESVCENKIDRGTNRVHLQIDEKYLNIKGNTNKTRYYTATIFSGSKQISRNKKQLLNKTTLSSFKLVDLENQINHHLLNRYKINIDETIYISGDFARYIRNFGERITVCKSIYVPDKFHLKKLLKDYLVDYFDINCSLTNNDNLNLLVNIIKTNKIKEAYCLVATINANNDAFKTYNDPEYLGCSQEGQNSHIYASRFGKNPNKFNSSTVEKLSKIREALVNNWEVVIKHKNREIKENTINMLNIEYNNINLEISSKARVAVRQNLFELDPNW